MNSINRNKKKLEKGNVERQGEQCVNEQVLKGEKQIYIW